MHYRLGKGKGIAFLRQHLDASVDECILWPYSTEQNGYGNFGFNGKVYRAHKYMCELAHGQAPTKRHEAAHSCGVAACVNPRHLSWKTRSENELDKRRHGTAKGGSGGIGGNRTLLRPEQIADIRANKGVVPADVLAIRHGLKRGGIRYWQSTTHDPFPPGMRTLVRTARHRR